MIVCHLFTSKTKLMVNAICHIAFLLKSNFVSVVLLPLKQQSRNFTMSVVIKLAKVEFLWHP